MPKNLFQEIIFTLMMVAVMVYAMVVYNISLDRGGLTNEVFLMAFGGTADYGNCRIYFGNVYCRALGTENFQNAF